MEQLLAQLAILVVAACLGFERAPRVPTPWRTPHTSATNAIHGVILVGGTIALPASDDLFTRIVGFIAVFFGALNVVGGFWVTNRMLGMFRPPVPKVKKRKR